MPEITWWPHFIVGAALCLAGWTLYWVGLHLTGAAVGGTAGVVLAVAIVVLSEIGNEHAAWIIPVAGLGGAAAGMFFIRKLHRLGFFLIGATMGMGVGWLGFEWTISVGKDYLEQRGIVPDPAIWHAVSVVGGSILGGLLMVIASKWIIAALTSVAGAALIALSIPDPLALLAILPVAAGSFLFQAGLLRRLTAKKKEKPEEKSSPD